MTFTWPKYLTENITRAGASLVSRMQSLFDVAQDEIDTVYDLNDPLRCPAKFLNTLGEDLHAEIQSGDSTRTKRVKNMNAVPAAKNKSLWEDDLKLRVEAVIGSAVTLFSESGSETLEDSIFWGGHDDRDRMWSVFGTTGNVDITAEGELFVGGLIGIPDIENFLPGIICINLGTTQTTAMLDQIILAINQEGGYVGHLIFIGYVSGDTFIAEAQA